jgi:hypothetical protein
MPFLACLVLYSFASATLLKACSIQNHPTFLKAAQGRKGTPWDQVHFKKLVFPLFLLTPHTIVTFMTCLCVNAWPAITDTRMLPMYSAVGLVLANFISWLARPFSDC